MRRCNRSAFRTAGFTLIEIILALAVLGIIAAIAIPSYQSIITRNRNNSAVADIAMISMMLERYRTANNFRFPPNLAALGEPIPADPWGNAYAYLNIEVGVPKGMVRKDKSLNPLNSDFDLYSMGADGETSLPLTAKKARDDIVRAGNGSFVGLAAEH